LPRRGERPHRVDGLRVPERAGARRSRCWSARRSPRWPRRCRPRCTERTPANCLAGRLSRSTAVTRRRRHRRPS